MSPSRGLTTPTLPHGDRSFTIAFDFIDHQLVIEASDGSQRSLALAPRSVADFYREVMATLRDMSLPVKIWPMPVEIPDPIRFDQDTVHRSYDPVAANRCWRILVQVAACAHGVPLRVSSASAVPSIFSGEASTSP